MSLDKILFTATKSGWATGHFNVSEFDQFRAIVEACHEAGAPAIVGTSEGERKHLGPAEIVAVRDAFRKDFDIPIFLNADHHKSVEAAKEAIDAGYDSVHIDLSGFPVDENIKGTRMVVEYARKKNPLISVEGEVGYFVTDSSVVREERVKVPSASLATPKEAARFTQETGVNRLAPAVGSFHGISKNEAKTIHIDLIREIRSAIPMEVALVLHGGSGLTDEQFREAITAGIANVHISTELRVAFMDALKKSLAEEANEAAMYKLDAAAINVFKKLVKEKLELFGAVHKI